MGRYVLQNRGIRDMRHVRPEIAAPRPAPAVAPPAAPPVLADDHGASDPVRQNYFLLTKAELIEIAIARGIDASGTRPELIGRLTHGS